MRRRFSIYDAETGQIKRVVGLPANAAIKPTLREGEEALESASDPLSQRVDIENGTIVDYRPAPPDDDHEWRDNAVNGRPRWVKKAEAFEREQRDAVARAAIAELEQKQIRSLVELWANGDARADDGRAVADIVIDRQAQIAEHRKDLDRPKTSSRGPTSKSIPKTPEGDTRL